MIHKLRVDELDRYFYHDHAARRRDFLLGSAMGGAVFFSLRTIGVSEVGSYLVTTLVIVSILLFRIAQYKPQLEYTRYSKLKVLTSRSFPLAWGIPAMIFITTALFLRSSKNANVPMSVINLAPGAVRAADLLETARNSKRDLSSAQLAGIETQIVTAVREAPESASTWKAAAQLVTYRSWAANTSSRMSSADSVPNTIPDCQSESPIATRQLTNTLNETNDRGPFMFAGGACRLSLDRSGSYTDGAIGQFFQELDARVPGTPHVINLDHAIVTYSGGEMIPINLLVCNQCTFEFSSPTRVPPQNGQSVTKQLLESSNLERTTLRLAPQAGL